MSSVSKTAEVSHVMTRLDGGGGGVEDGKGERTESGAARNGPDAAVAVAVLGRDGQGPWFISNVSFRRERETRGEMGAYRFSPMHMSRRPSSQLVGVSSRLLFLDSQGA